MKRHARTGAAVVLAALTLASPAQARDVVRVDWIFANMEVAPLPGSHADRVNTVFILDGNRITDGNNTTARLGETRRGTSQYDVGYSVRYAARGGHLTKTIHTVGTNLRVDVVFLREGGCRATVEYFRSPGKAYFETRRVTNHERMIESDQHAENVTCTFVSPTPTG